MRSAQQWFAAYAQTHQHPTNKRIHFFCVPLIMWSLLALLWHVPLSPIERLGIPFANGATLLLLFACVFYARLGFQYLFGMVGVAGLMLGLTAVMDAAHWPLIPIALAVFVGAWIGQFVGHKIEGKKPSFFEDLLFLLIGPLWILTHLTTRWGRRNPIDE